VSASGDPGSTARGVLVLGRGVAGRLEVAVEVGEDVRHRGLGRAPASAALHLADEPVWPRVATGNARSLRAFQSAGHRPVGAEALPIARGRRQQAVTADEL
jgi:hypothetical protein